MLRFLKHILQLILSPARGWEDISASGDEPSELCRTGLYPILGVLALSNFIQLFYGRIDLVQALERAVIDFGIYFACYFLGALILEQTIGSMVQGEINRRKIDTVSVYAMALMAITGIIPNCLPAPLSLMIILPVFVALVVYKSYRYLTISRDDDVRFLLISACALVALPFTLRYCLVLLI